MSKKARADAFMLAGNKCAETGFFKWTPNWDGAAKEWKKAGDAYKLLKLYSNSLTAYRNASNAYFQLQLYYSAAQMIENAAIMAKEDKAIPQAATFYKKAAALYAKDGNDQKAAATYHQAAMLIAETDWSQAADMLFKATSLYMAQSKAHYAVDCYRNLLDILVMNSDLTRAMEVLDNQMQLHKSLNQSHNVYRAFVSKLLIWLYQGKFTTAENALNNMSDSVPEFMMTSDYRWCDKTLTIYCSGDKEQFDNQIKSAITVVRDLEVGKLALKMKLPAPGEINRSGGNEKSEEQLKAELFGRAEPKQNPFNSSNNSSTTSTTSSKYASLEEFCGGTLPPIQQLDLNDLNDPTSFNSNGAPQTPQEYDDFVDSETAPNLADNSNSNNQDELNADDNTNDIPNNEGLNQFATEEEDEEGLC